MEQISQIKEYAVNHSVPIIQDEGIDFILNYIKNNRVKNILEIGTAIGYSSIKFANLGDDIFVSTIEYDIERYQQAVKNVHDNNLMDRITLYLGDALKFDLKDKFDLIFIDGAKAQYINFFEHFKHNLSENGVFISDNLSFHGMVEDLSLTHNYSTIRMVKKLRRYIDFLKTNLEFETTFYKLGDGLSVSRKKPCCKWCLNEHDKDGLLQKFHDSIWGNPITSDDLLLELFILNIFQEKSDLLTVLKNREIIAQALMHYNLNRLSNLTDTEINNSLNILRNSEFAQKALILSAKTNTQIFMQIQKEYSSFSNYIWSFKNQRNLENNIYNSFIQKGFTNITQSSTTAYLQTIGLINNHEPNCWKSKL